MLCLYRRVLISNVLKTGVDCTRTANGTPLRKVSCDCSQEVGVVEPPTNGDSCHSGVLPQDAAFFIAVHNEVLTVNR